MRTQVLTVTFQGCELSYQVSLSNGSVFILNARKEPFTEEEQVQLLDAIIASGKCPIVPAGIYQE